VRLGLATGDCVAGVPEAPPEAAGGEQLDDTGYADTITVDGVAVRLSDVVEPASGARRRPERRATPPSGRPREIAAIERKAAGEAEPAQ
jgi:hypothetical protein